MRSSSSDHRRSFFLIAVLFEGGLGGVGLLLGWWWGYPVWSQFHWNWLGVGQALMATLPMLLMLWGVTHLNWGPLRRFDKFVQNLIVPLFSQNRVIELLLISVAAGFGEEVLFRGLLQSALADQIGLAGGILLTGVLFGFFHPMSRMYIVLAAGVGVYLGIVQWWSSNLLVPVFAHGLYDFLAILYWLRRERVEGAQ